MSGNQDEPRPSTSAEVENNENQEEKQEETRPPNISEGQQVLQLVPKKIGSLTNTVTMEADTTGITLDITSNESSQTTDDQEQTPTEESSQNEDIPDTPASPDNNEGFIQNDEETSNDDSSTSGDFVNNAEAGREQEAPPYYNNERENVILNNTAINLCALWHHLGNLRAGRPQPPVIDPEIIDVDEYAERVEREAQERERQRELDASPPNLVIDECQEPMNLVRPSQPPPDHRAMDGPSGSASAENMSKRRRLDNDNQSHYVDDGSPTHSRAIPRPVFRIVPEQRGLPLRSPRLLNTNPVQNQPRPVDNPREAAEEGSQAPPAGGASGGGQMNDVVNGAIGPSHIFSSFLQTGFPGGLMPAALCGLRRPPPPPVAVPAPVNVPPAQDNSERPAKPDETVTTAFQTEDQGQDNLQGGPDNTYRSI